jgi:hypothetical protein
MKVLLRSRSLAAGGLLALALAALIPATALAKPEPGARPRGFRLFARTLGAITVNRVYLGLSSSKGNIGVDSTNSSTIGGGFWPRGSGNQFVFNSGLQIAGKVDNPGGAWDGDVTGAFFFDPKGTTEHGDGVEPIYNFANPADAGAWPDAARVPVEINEADNFYNPILRGIISASQGDVWFVTWDGNSTLIAGRPHPLGVAVESRGLAWNYPAGNEDIVYFTFSFYNVTASDPAAYSAVRPAIRPVMQQLGAQFVSSNSSRFRVALPAGGYAIDSLFSAFAADMDVSNAGSNYCSVNIPFALGYCYEHTFTFDPTSGESYDNPTIWGPPFFGGPGFVGVKYLRSPTGVGEIQLFSNTINSATGFRDPANVFQLFRYLSGNLDPSQGDQACNVAGGFAVGICFINPAFADARFYQSSTALNLPPGGFGSIVVAYIFAAPVAIPGFTPTTTTDVTPGNPVILTNSGLLSVGANQIDSLTGFNGYTDVNGDAEVEQSEFRTVSGSLLNKALTAQVIFDNGFLLPFAPTAPNFYLIPGNNSVSIVWQPTASEVTGDPFYAVASDPGTPLEPNLLYDPNYRQYDVEGYRIYRGRVDNQGALTLVAQFDYAGTEMSDFSGQIQPVSTCAPELGVTVNCAVAFDYVQFSGVPATVSTAYPLVGQFVQVKLGSASRVVVNPGQVPGADCVAASCALVIANADTALTGSGGQGGPYPQLSDNGVPFGYIDNEPKNNFRYFYAVTAFDVNSFQSGPSSLESPRIGKPVTPSVTGTNVVAPVLTSSITGTAGTALNVDAPFDIDAATGRFNGTPAPTNGVSGAFAPLIPALLPALDLKAKIDSVVTYFSENPKCGGVTNFGGGGTCYIFYVTFNKDGVETPFVTVTPWPIWSNFDGINQYEAQLGAQPVNIDPAAAATYGIPGTLTGSAAVGITERQYIQFSSFEGQAARRGLVANNTAALCGASLTNCQNAVSAGGSRWFQGANETLDHPAVSIKVGGGLTGVDTVWAPIHHVQRNPLTPTATASTSNNGIIQFWGYGFAGLGRQADVVLTWGSGGTASLQDVTHDVPVKFNPQAAASWGFVTDADGSGYVDWADFNYAPNVAEWWISPNGVDGAGFFGPATLADTVRYVETATPGPVSTQFDPVSSTGVGIGLYINGERYIFQLTGGALPPPGTKWTLRTYSGIVRTAAGNAANGTLAAGTTPTGYSFAPVVRSPGVAGLTVQFTVAQPTGTVAATNLDLRQVHTVPDPYYVTNGFEATTESKVLQFVNLPTQAIIRIYTSSGILVNLIEHNSTDFSGSEAWNLRNRNNQVVASGVYFYMIEAGDARRVGRFTVVNFAQ